MPPFETTRRRKLADIRDAAALVRGSAQDNPVVHTLGGLLVDLVDALDPEVAAYCDKRNEDWKRDRARGGAR